eukprot:c25704_g1_i3 orf=410-1459(+)
MRLIASLDIWCFQVRMASSFQLWEMDPFFGAAEDVQQSADRLQSSYRMWLHSKGAIEELDECFCKRELLTALDTTKWQLEEFQRAVTESSQGDNIYMGEADKRHHSFIEAVKNQILLIEKELHRCLDMQLSKHCYSVPLNSDDRNQLALFLSGCPTVERTSQGDGRIHPIDKGDSTNGFLISLHNSQEDGNLVERNTEDKCDVVDSRFPSINGCHIPVKASFSVEGDLRAVCLPYDKSLSISGSELCENGLKNENLSQSCECHVRVCGEAGCTGECSDKQTTIDRLTNMTRMLQRKLQVYTHVFKKWRDGYMPFSKGKKKERKIAVDENGFAGDRDLLILDDQNRARVL